MTSAPPTDGADGYAEARSGDYGVIVLDVMLPNMSGLEISLRLHRQGAHPSVASSADEWWFDMRAGG